MKIAIVGGGWVGCHIAYKFKNEHSITLFEKNNNIFNETSFKNQNRLHLGYHYPRSFDTRELCKSSFDSFINDYGFLTESINNNLYCISKKTSLLDFETYLQIYEDMNHTIVNQNFKNVSGCIDTKEKHINFQKAKLFFENELKDLIFFKKISKKDIPILSKNFDLVIDATNNHLNLNKKRNVFFELTLTLVYKKKRNYPFGGITLVDGKLFSIYPYYDEYYTVTDVLETPIGEFSKLQELNSYKEKITQEFIEKKKKSIELNIKNYYPSFSRFFSYSNWFISTKVKVKNYTDSRTPVIDIKDNIISCFTGKIQGIYIIEDFIRRHINSKKIL